jgi:Malonate decarboxylase, alpha subunit, transporter
VRRKSLHLRLTSFSHRGARPARGHRLSPAKAPPPRIPQLSAHVAISYNCKAFRVHRHNKDLGFFRKGTRNAAPPAAKYTAVSATPGHGQESDRHLSGRADFLASAWASVDPMRFHDLHMAQSVLALPDHLAVFERGIANRLDFAYAGPQSHRLAEPVASKTSQDRRDPRLSRTLCAHAGGPDADGGLPAAGRHPHGLGFVIPSPKAHRIDPLFTPILPRSGTRTPDSARPE